MKISISILLNFACANAQDRFIERGPAYFQECLDNGLDFISQRDQAADGKIECSGSACVLKCETGKGYQTYGGKAWKIKCIKTKKGYKWNKELGVCRTCNPLKYKSEQLDTKCKTNRKGIKTCNFTCKKNEPIKTIYPMNRNSVLATCVCMKRKPILGGRCYWRMKPNTSVVLDEGNRNKAEEWSCGRSGDVTTTQAPTTTEAAVTAASTHAPEPTTPVQQTRVRIPQNLVCDNPANAEADRIINGLAAHKNSWPWIAYIKFGYGGFCGGTIVDSYTVVTAAHCCRRYQHSPHNVKVVIGEHHKRQLDQGQEQINVSQVIIHDDFRLSTLDSDICLLKTTDMNLNAKARYAAPACLPEQDSPDPAEGTVCWTAGWGRMANRKLPDILQEVDLELISDETCRNTRNADMLNENMFCAGYLEGGKDGCQGDSGGPFICAENGQPVLRGVTSWGWGCAQRNSPGVWVRTAKFTNWIQNHLGPN